MTECDGFFDQAQIPFDPAFEDEAIYWARSDPHLTREEKKFYIQCWYDVTFGQWNGSRFDMKESRAMMASFIRKTEYATFEALIDATEERPTDARKS